MRVLLAVALLLLTSLAHADECNPNLSPDVTPNCHLLKPQFRQCRPDVPLNTDMDILDTLCGACNACDPNPCLNGGTCVLQCPGGFACICPPGITGTICQMVTTTTTTLPMPECANVGDPCGSCSPAGICLPRCDGTSCQFVCVQVIGSPCDSIACMSTGPTAVCVDATPMGCVDGVCDTNRECGTPCFGPTPTTTTTSTTTTSTVTTTTVTTTTTTGTGPTTTTTTTTTTTLTTTTSTTSTTTTTTSTTTTTTIVDSVTILWVPAVPMRTVNNLGVGTADLLQCTAWTPTLGIQHGTSVSFDAGCPGPDKNFSISIYNFNGTTRITTTGQTFCTFNGNYQINTGDFSLSAGTKYQVCACGEATNIIFTVPQVGTSSAVSQLAQAFSGGELRTTAANGCTAGAPPLTTGALTPAQHDLIPIMLIGTSTP